MKAISVKQPWAWLIVRGYKDIENRSWLTKVRGRVLIHASQKFDSRALTHHRLRGTILSILTANNLKPEDLQRGGIVGSVEIVDCVASDPGMWFDGEFGWKLQSPEILTFAPCRGKLNFFELPEIPR